MAFFTDLAEGFTGKSQRRDITQGTEQAQGALRQGAEEFKDTTNDFLGRSTDFLQPDIEGGRNALAQLLAATGVSGRGAQIDFFNNFQTDPGFEAVTDAGIQGLDRSAAARGMLFSGGQLRDVGDFVGRRRNQAFNERLERLVGLAGIGSRQATNAAGFTQQAGSNIAGSQFGTNQLLANLAQSQGNALAQSRSIPINNLIAIGNAAAQGVGAFAGAGGFGGGGVPSKPKPDPIGKFTTRTFNAQGNEIF